MNLAIDIGNSTIKIGLFNKGNLVHVEQFKSTVVAIPFKKIIAKYGISRAIICNVSSNNNKQLLKTLKQHFPVISLGKNTPTPVHIGYKTPQTLGKDRLAVAVAGNALFPKNNVLIIQAGTCITYDLITAHKKYLGGAISPGLAMRFKALHTFTGKLPLITPENITYRLGTTTKESILSGVVNGLCDEINAAMAYYSNRYKNLKIILTGGDAYFFESKLKNEIFAQPNLVLHGLNKILEYNVKN